MPLNSTQNGGLGFWITSWRIVLFPEALYDLKTSSLRSSIRRLRSSSVISTHQSAIWDFPIDMAASHYRCNIIDERTLG
jgi:hypothetical protein